MERTDIVQMTYDVIEIAKQAREQGATQERRRIAALLLELADEHTTISSARLRGFAVILQGGE